MADLRKQLVRNEGDNALTRMQNDELRRQIGRAEELRRETVEKRVKAKFDIDKVYNDVFLQSDTMKLYDKTIQDLGKASAVEKACLEELKGEVKALREMLAAEQAAKDELKQVQVVQRKQIETLGLKHDRGTEALERNLNGMNDCINEAVRKGHVSVKQLERNTKNMIAAQDSKFFMSKYQSKYYSSMNNSKFNVSRYGFENRSIMGQIKEED